MAKAAAWALAAALLLSACAGDPDSSAEEPPPSSTTTTTFDRAAEEQAVIAAYLAGVEAFYTAANPPSPDHPALAETATGSDLADSQAFLADLRGRGVGLRRGEFTTNNPRIARLTATAAVVEDCVIDADVQFELTSGAVVDDALVYGRVTARLVKRDSGWLVETKTLEKLSKTCESPS